MDPETIAGDVRSVFELLDEHPQLELDERVPGPVEWIDQEGVPPGEFGYHHEGGGLIWGESSSAVYEKEGLLFEAALYMFDEEGFLGDVMPEPYLMIIENTSAPYLEGRDSDRDMERVVEDQNLGRLDIPANYDSGALEESVAAAATRLNAAARLQDHLETEATSYVEERRYRDGDNTAHQQ